MPLRENRYGLLSLLAMASSPLLGENNVESNTENTNNNNTNTNNFDNNYLNSLNTDFLYSYNQGFTLTQLNREELGIFRDEHLNRNNDNLYTTTIVDSNKQNSNHFNQFNPIINISNILNIHILIL